MSYTKATLRDALNNVVESHGGVHALFSRHPVYRDGKSADAFLTAWPRMSLENQVGKVACIVGPVGPGDAGVVCRAYYDLCTKNHLQPSTGMKH